MSTASDECPVPPSANSIPGRRRWLDSVMGVFTVNGSVLWLGWLATMVLGAAVPAMLVLMV